MFDLKKILNGRMNVPEPERYVAGVDITPGMALKLSGGKLVISGATEVPGYVSMGKAAANTLCAVAPVAHDQIYEVEITAAPTSLTEGAKVTLTTDGLGVTATTTSGVATIVSLNGAAAAGDKIMIKF
jgi:hypothetical protein